MNQTKIACANDWNHERNDKNRSTVEFSTIKKSSKFTRKGMLGESLYTIGEIKAMSWEHWSK